MSPAPYAAPPGYQPQPYAPPPYAPQGYGQQGYAPPPNPYGPGAYPQYAPPPRAVPQTSGWTTFWQAMNVLRLVRLGFALVVLVVVGIGACARAVTHR